jgi:hypothetical protein
LRGDEEEERKQQETREKTKSMSASLKSSYLAHQQVTGTAVIRATNDWYFVFFLGHVQQAPQSLSLYLFLYHAKFGCSLLRGRFDHEAEKLSAWQEDNGRVHTEARSPRRVMLACGMRESVRQEYLTKR